MLYHLSTDFKTKIMKKLIIVIVSIIASFSIYAQEDEVSYQNNEEFKTIFGGKTMGGYGALGLGYTEIDNQAGVILDARGGVVMGHSFAFGVGGVGFVTDDMPVQSLNAGVSLVGGYGGIFAEFIVFPRSSVHLSFPVLAGLGAAAATTWTSTDNSVSYQNQVEQSSIFMVIEPAVELEFNLTRFFRMAGFFSYRYTTDLDLDSEYASPAALNNYSAGVRFKFGKF